MFSSPCFPSSISFARTPVVKKRKGVFFTLKADAFISMQVGQIEPVMLGDEFTSFSASDTLDLLSRAGEANDVFVQNAWTSNKSGEFVCLSDVDVRGAQMRRIDRVVIDRSVHSGEFAVVRTPGEEVRE